MSTNHTPNYALSQWSKDDRVLMDDFNADNAKIDAALAELQAGQLRLYCGTYEGTGQSEFSLEIPFKPKLMMIQKSGGNDERLLIAGSRAVLSYVSEDKATFTKSNGNSLTATWTDTTISITSIFSGSAYRNMLNQRDTTYLYFLIG